MQPFLVFLPKNTFWACLLLSRLKDIFQLQAQSWTSIRSVSVKDEASRSCISENSKMLSANNSTSECKPSGRSLIQIRDKSGPKTMPCGTPALSFWNFEEWQLETTLWSLLCKEDSIKLWKLPSCLPCVKDFYATLFNASDKSRKIPQNPIDRLALKAVKILCVKATGWCIQEASGLKSDWSMLSKQFWSEK